MYFSRIALYNFGIYKGVHEMRLTDKVGNRNVTLIGGLNGRGKTTLHDAALLALYGKQALKYMQENARSYDRFLLDHIHKSAAVPEAYVEVTLVLENDSVLTVRRSWQSRNGKITQSVHVTKDNKEDSYLAESWQYYVEEILPFGIAKFFFFNNEKITQLADDASFEQIKSSIKSAIGVTTIENAIGHLNAVIRRKKEALQAFEKGEVNQEYQQIQTQLADSCQKLEQTRREVEAMDMGYGELVARMEATEEQFWASGGELSRNRDEILKERQRVSEEAARVRSEVLQMVSNAATPLLLCQNLVRQVYNEADGQRNANAQRYYERMLRALRERVAERLRDFQVSDEIMEAIERVITEELGVHAEETPEMTTVFSASGLLSAENLISHGFSSMTGRIGELIGSQKDYESQIMNLDTHLKEADDKTEAMRLFEDLKELEKQRSVRIYAIQKKQDEIASLERHMDILKARRIQLLTNILGKENENDDNARIIQYAAMSIEALREFERRLQHEKVEKLSETVTSCFQSLVGKTSLVKRIEIHPDTLDVTMTDANGAELFKHQLSAGEQQMFAVSIVWALALTSGYQAPVMIDTPMARLDSIHRENFVRKYLPAASSQVIVLSTDEEVYGGYLDALREYVVDSYTLKYRDSEQCTSIVHGYFEEA